jgi:hypothetical protein
VLTSDGVGGAASVVVTWNGVACFAVFKEMALVGASSIGVTKTNMAAGLSGFLEKSIF